MQMMLGQWCSKSIRNIVFCVTASLITCFLIASPAVTIYAQSINSEVAQWLVPLDLGKELKIKCNGSLTSPSNCKSLRQAGNDILECNPNSQSESADEQVIFP